MKPDFTVSRFMGKEPFRNPVDAAWQKESLLLAGLPDSEPPWVREVLRFWFEELTDRDWFAKDADLDARIRERFLATHAQVVARGVAYPADPRTMLAAVVVLDQFSRNLFRNDPRAFAADAVARRIATSAIENGFDRAMNANERLFLYLPFEHSEDRADQARALELIGSLGNDVWTRSAIAHKDIIDRFGRFPHRNAVLKRESSAAELALLKDPKGSF